MIRRFELRARKFVTLLLTERLDPGHAAAAVFSGIFIGILPVYGFHAVTAVGVALLFKLNKPLTLAGTFISNPLLQPFLVFSSVELGCLLYRGSFQRLTLSELAAASAHLNREQILIFITGSMVLGVILGAVGAAVTATVIHLHRKRSLNSEVVVL
jgi:uncharacterized protein (DUF2062 family)